MSGFEIHISNMSKLLEYHKSAKASRYPLSITAIASRNDISDSAGSGKTGISVRRSFHCVQTVVMLDFHVLKIKDLKHSANRYNVDLSLCFTSIKVQPFLVDELESFNNPQFCE